MGNCIGCKGTKQVFNQVSASTFRNNPGSKFNDNYKIGRMLGKGTYGQVHICHHKVTKEERAVKFVKKAKLTNKEAAVLKTEIAILAEMDHPNIAKLYEFYDDNDMTALVTEVCKGGELYEQMSKTKKISEKYARIFINRLLHIVSYYHESGIVHRDLKP